MNVSCPKCQTVFRVDPAKVPPRGVRARCSVCAGVFFVGAEPAPAVPAVSVPAAPPVTPPQPAPLAAQPAPVQAVVAPPVVSPPVAPAVMPPARPPAVPASAPAPTVAAPAPPAVSPPAVRAPAAPPLSAPVSQAFPSAPPAVPAAQQAPPPPRRSVNPFLAQDPATKARRLARALISDLVVYHPAKRAEGLRDGTLKLLFEDEIRKCWDEYTEQVGMEMASSTRYFTEALNEILADGQPVFT